MKKFLKCFIVLTLVLSILITPFEAFAEYSDDDYCYDMSCQITQATIDYLNEIYIKKYPNLGTGYLYGSNADKAVLETLSNKICSGLNTDKQKIDAIANWVAKNIEYRSIFSNTYQYPIDVFYHREGNCVGTSQLIRHLARCQNIPVVICDGTRGNMKEYIKLGFREMDHEWVMAYVDNEWLLYDPLFSVFGVADQDFISTWYFTDHIEGVSPYYDGMDYKYVNYGDSIFYIDGRFMHCEKGTPASQIHGCSSKGGTSTNGCISYFANTFYDAFADDTCLGNDGFMYLENDERRENMVNDQCYSNGWLTYGNSLQYAKENGIMLANQFVEKDGKVLFAPYDGGMLEIVGYKKEIETTDGYITIHKDIDNFKLIPSWADAEKSIGRVIGWENYSKDIVDIDSTGNITVLGEGLATLVVMSMEPDSDGHHLADFVQVYVTKNGYRKYSYEDTSHPCDHTNTTTKTVRATTKENGKVYTLCADCGKTLSTKTVYYPKTITLSTTKYTYDGKVKKPAVTVKDANGKTIASSNYTVTYPSGRKLVGKYTVKITFKGNYSGTVSKSFTIVPKGTTISSLSAVSKGFTAKWKKQATQTTGYQIQIATDSKFSKGVKTYTVTKNSTVSKKITKLTGKKKYYVRIRTYKTVSGTKYYSSWSASKYVTTKK